MTTKQMPHLERATFNTSRTMDFFSAKELVTQTGHEMEDWPLVVAKELVDNALDACEEANLSPVIDVVVDACGITVADHGPGLPESTLKGAMDFTVRASSREAYIAPDRGAQGNALKTILPMPRVVDPENGKLILKTRGKRHTIICGVDPISQRPVIDHDAEELAKSKNLPSGNGDKASFTSGTQIRLEWGPHGDADGNVTWPFGNGISPLGPREFSWVPSFAEHFRSLIEAFAVFNPHATLRLNWFGEVSVWEATNPAWEKWKPNKPTSPHWYEPSHLERLVAAYITHDRDHGSDRLVSDFLAEFDGLSGTKKRSQVLEETGLKRAPLSALAEGDELDRARTCRLLEAMRRHSRPVKSRRLGVIGEDHLRARLLGMGVQPDSFQYRRKLGKDGLPYVLEAAFGWKGDDSDDWRHIVTGANWSAAIGNPFRSFGATGEGLEGLLENLRAGAHEPIVFVLHLSHPRVEYRDRGKSALVIGGAEEC